MTGLLFSAFMDHFLKMCVQEWDHWPKHRGILKADKTCCPAAYGKTAPHHQPHPAMNGDPPALTPHEHSILFLKKLC